MDQVKHKRGRQLMGIHHLEFWVRDWKRSGPFYDGLFRRVGWEKMSPNAYFYGETEIYFIERPQMKRQDSLGPRHICLHAGNRETVEEVARWLQQQEVEIIRGPVEMPQYSPGYYTVDFRDPDGYIWEVAHTPNMRWEKQEEFS